MQRTGTSRSTGSGSPSSLRFTITLTFTISLQVFKWRGIPKLWVVTVLSPKTFLMAGSSTALEDGRTCVNRSIFGELENPYFFLSFSKWHPILLIVTAPKNSKSFTMFLTEKIEFLSNGRDGGCFGPVSSSEHPQEVSFWPRSLSKYWCPVDFFLLIPWNQDLVLHDFHRECGTPDMSSSELWICNAWQASSMAFSFGPHEPPRPPQWLVPRFPQRFCLRSYMCAVNLQINLGIRYVQISVSIANSGF